MLGKGVTVTFALLSMVACALLETEANGRGDQSAKGADQRAAHSGICVDGRRATTYRRVPTWASETGKPATTAARLIGGDFSTGLADWTVSESGGGTTPGNVMIAAGAARIGEGDSFLVSLQQTFAMPGGAATLTFDLSLLPGFDRSDDLIPDAFEAQLLDANNLPVVPTWDPLATSFFNIQEDGTVNLGSTTSFDGETVTLLIENVAAETPLTIYFDLIGADGDTGSGVTIDNVTLTVLNEPPTCNAGGAYEAQCGGATTSITLDGSGSSDPDVDDTLSFAWTSDCNDATFDDSTTATPTLTLPAACPTLPTCDVTLTLTDDAGASSSCSAAITVRDATPPQITCPANAIIECDGAGNLAEHGDWLAATGAIDACGTVTVAEPAVEESPGCGETASLSATWTATDACGLTGSCSAEFTIVDTTPPELTVDTTPIEVVDTDCSGDEPVVLSSATAFDACGDAQVAHDAPATFAAGDATTVTYSATDDCGNTATATRDVQVAYGANIEVIAVRHTVGTGSTPGSTKTPLVGIDVCGYDKSAGSCARLVCGGISHQYYECIATTCEASNCCTTDAAGTCTIDLPPGDYIVISNDATKTVLPDPLGVSAGELLCGQTLLKYLQQIVKADGQKVPAKTTRLTGSELLIIEPEYVVWDDAQQLYPFVFESIGNWNVTVSVSPPPGFVSSVPSLSERVDNEIESVQFTITEVGSDLLPTGTVFQTTHNGRDETVESAVDIYLTSAYARSQGLDVELLAAQGLIKDPVGQDILSAPSSRLCGVMGTGCGPIGPALIPTLIGLLGLRLLGHRRPCRLRRNSH